MFIPLLDLFFFGYIPTYPIRLKGLSLCIKNSRKRNAHVFGLSPTGQIVGYFAAGIRNACIYIRIHFFHARFADLITIRQQRTRNIFHLHRKSQILAALYGIRITFHCDDMILYIINPKE